MTRRTKQTLIIAVVAIVAVFAIAYAPQYLQIMKPAPPGIHGNYSITGYDPVYKTSNEKDSLLQRLEKDGLEIKSGRLHDYDPPWDSLRYVIGNIPCGTEKIESYIEFSKEKQDSLTTFRVLWMNAAPNESYDTALYNTMARKYYDCFETILSRHGVRYK